MKRSIVKLECYLWDIGSTERSHPICPVHTLFSLTISEYRQALMVIEL